MEVSRKFTFFVLFGFLPFSFAFAAQASGEGVLKKTLRLHRYGKTELAVKRLRDMLKTDPDNTGAQGLLGIILSDMGSDYADEAIEWLNKAIEGRPEEPDYHVGLCRALRNLGGKRLEDAAAECRKALELDTRRYSVYRERGLLYQTSGDLKKAVRTWERGAQVAPGNYLAHYQLGLGYLKISSNSKALKSLKKALSLAEKSAAAPPSDYFGIKLALGNALLKKSRPEESLEMYRQVTRQDLDEKWKKKARDGIKSASSVLRKRRKRVDRFQKCMASGRKFYKDGKFAVAGSEFRRCLGINPDNAKAHVSLAGAMMANGNLADAENEFKAGLKLLSGAEDSPHLHAYCHLGLGDIAFKQGDGKSAKAHYEKTLLFEPKSAEAQAGLGKYYQSMEMWGEALDSYKKALELDPDNSVARLGIDKAERLYVNPAGMLAEMKERKAVNSTRMRLSEEEIFMFHSMRKAEKMGAVDFLKSRVRSLSGYVIEKKEKKGPILQVSLLLTLSGFQAYQNYLTQAAIRVFELNDVNAKHVFGLRDRSGKPLFDSSGKLTPEGEAVYLETLDGYRMWLFPGEPAPEGRASLQDQRIGELIKKGYTEISEPEYLWLLRVTDCPEDVMEDELKLIILRSTAAKKRNRYLVHILDSVLGSYVERYRSGDTSIPGLRSTAFFGTGSVQGRRLCHNGKIWRGE